MRALILLALLGIMVAPAFALVPAAEACQPYSYYCPVDHEYHWACSGQLTPNLVTCALTAADP